MNNKKKISLFLTKLKLAYPRYFKDLKNEDFVGLLSVLEELLANYNEETLNEVAKNIIKTKKYMPTIAEILEICDNTKIIVRNEIVEYMKKQGYFKSPREIEKVYNWLEDGIIPSWFKQDMMKYYNEMIKNKTKMIA